MTKQIVFPSRTETGDVVGLLAPERFTVLLSLSLSTAGRTYLTQDKDVVNAERRHAGG